MARTFNLRLMGILEDGLITRLLSMAIGSQDHGLTWQLFSLTSQLEQFYARLQLLSGREARDLLLDMIFQMRLE